MALGTETIEPGRPDRRAGQRLRGRGQAPAVRRGRHRPVRRPDRDPGRSPTTQADPFVVAVDLLSPGRARPGLAGRPDHHRPRTLGRRGRWSTSSELLPGHADQGLRRAGLARPRPGASWSTTSTRRIALADSFAAEHVQVLTASPRQALDADARLRRPVPRRGHLRLLRRQGDRHQPRAADPGAARYTGGLWVGKYLKTVTYQEVTRPGVVSAALGEVCGRAARVELFEGHARSGDVRACASTATAPLPWIDDGVAA